MACEIQENTCILHLAQNPPSDTLESVGQVSPQHKKGVQFFARRLTPKMSHFLTGKNGLEYPEAGTNPPNSEFECTHDVATSMCN